MGELRCGGQRVPQREDSWARKKNQKKNRRGLPNQSPEPEYAVCMKPQAQSVGNEIASKTLKLCSFKLKKKGEGNDKKACSEEGGGLSRESKRSEKLAKAKKQVNASSFSSPQNTHADRNEASE